MNDAQQDMLFASLGRTIVDDTVAATEARICALNAHTPSPQRAQQLVDWLIGTACNVLVLTELRRSDGGRRIIASLEADGYTVLCPLTDHPEQYTTLLATKGFTVNPVAPPPFDPRIVVADLQSPGGALRLAGVYGPSNGMTADSSTIRASFQRRLIDYLTPLATPNLCVTGDLNVVDRQHRPHLPAYGEHDYAFYEALTTGLRLHDVYRTTNPTGGEHSWFSDRYGNQRLDHLLIGRELTGTLAAFRYDHGPRTEKLSDHAAVIATLRWSA